MYGFDPSKRASTNLRIRSARLRKAGEGPSSASGQPGESVFPSIRKLPLLGVTYADLYRQTKVQEAVYETLTQEYELAKVQEAKEIPTVKCSTHPIFRRENHFLQGC